MSKLVRFHIVMIAASLCSASFVYAEQEQRYDMWEEPSHQLVFVNGPARVLDVRIAPGATSDFHKHRFATAYVIIQDALVANQYWEDEWSASGPRELREAGVTVDNANYVEKPYYHRVRNEDEKPFHVVAVINERSASGAADSPEPGAPVDNAWFKEHRVQVGPETNSNTLKFDNDVVVVQFDDGPSHVIEDGVAHGYKSAPAGFSWHRAGSEFSIVNPGKRSVELVLIEVRE